MKRLDELLARFKMDDKGAMGIGTLIIFIAMVLVAAVAAGVLIQTSGFLQQKAATTGRASTEQVASGIAVDRVTGYVTTIHGTVDKLAIFVQPNAGSTGIDLSTAILSLSNGNKKTTFAYSSSYFDNSLGYADVFSTTNAWGAGATNFGVIVLQDEDNSLTSANPTINKGDKVVIAVNASAAFSGISERTDMSGEVRPEFGAPGIVEFTTPPAYTTNVISLQ